MKFVAALFLVISTAAFGQIDDIVGQGMLYDFIQKADEITIYSLDPSAPAVNQPSTAPADNKVQKPGPEKFHEYVVFGKVVGTPKEFRDRLRNILVSAVVSPEDMYECFSPRIGVSLVCQGRRLDILLCYQCHQTRFFMGDDSDEGQLGNAGESEFNAIFDQRGIKRDIPKPRPAPVQ